MAEVKSVDVSSYRYEYIHNETDGLVNANNEGSVFFNGDDLTSQFATNGNASGEGKIAISLSQGFDFFDQTFNTIYVLRTVMHLFQILQLMKAIHG